jgi:tripartite-type tricarboxylate transporter receptor subunit TctC
MMRPRRRRSPIAIAIACLASAFVAPSGRAQDARSFYEARPQLHLIVSSTPGGGYDFAARLIARFLTKYLPGNPAVLVQNMPGAGGIKAANFLYTVAPKDGTTFGLIDRSVPTAPILYGKTTNADYDATKFAWVGSLARDIGVGIMSSRAKAKTVTDLKQIQTTLGSNGIEVDSTMYARLMNALVGTKFKVVTGYPGQTEYYLAMEKGETDGMFMSGWSGPNAVQVRSAVAKGELVYFVQMAARPVPEFGNTPTIMQLLSSDEDRNIMEILLSRLDLGRPFVAPPGTPSDRLDLLRKAFWQAANDPDVAAEAAKGGINVDPIEGAEAQKLIEKIYATPAPIKARIQQILQH